MPNHCGNSLTVNGKLSHRQEFVDKNKGFFYEDKKKEKDYAELSFHAQVPVPKKHINGKGEGWYSWCLKNWGTKWDCWEAYLSHDDNTTEYSFDTAWGSPVDWVEKVSRKFPHLKFMVTWAEEGGSGGKYMYQGGDCFFATQMTVEEWKEYMGIEEDEE